MTLIVNSIRNDLMQTRNNVSQSLALAATANLGAHTCIHTYTYMHTYIHTHSHTYIHTHIHTLTPT